MRAFQTALEAVDYRNPNIIPTPMVVRGAGRSCKPAVRDMLNGRFGDMSAGRAAALGAPPG